MFYLLSRLVHETQNPVPFEEDDSNNFLYTLDAGCMEITWDEIEKATERDNELMDVKEAVETNYWPKKLRKFEAHKKELHFLGYLVFKGENSIPKTLRIKAMNSAHGGHVGEVAMKRIMRRFFWWPGMSQDVIHFVKSCETCAVLARKKSTSTTIQ